MTVVASEQFANKASTTLNGAINSSTTTVVVTDASLFPSSGNFRILIDSEIMLVTAVSSNTFTVTRHVESTSGASHADLAPVTHILTAGALDARVADNVGAGPDANRPSAGKAGRIWLPDSGLVIQRDDGTNWNSYGPIYKFNRTSVADFSAVNHGSETFTDVAGTIQYQVPKSGNTIDWRLLAKSAPVTPYHIITAFSFFVGGQNSNVQVGVGFRESSSGKISMFYFSWTANSGGALKSGVNNITDPHTGTVTALLSESSWFGYAGRHVMWLRIGDDGTTNRTYDISPDGTNWVQITSQARATYLTADQVCFGVNNSNSGTGVDCFGALLSWQATG